MSRKQRATVRLLEAKLKRSHKQAEFLVKLANRRGMTIESEVQGNAPCQHGHAQLVSEVVPMGGVYFYKSKACAGCEQGATYINKLAERTEPNVKLPRNCLGCHLVQNNFLVSRKPVEKGQVVIASDPAFCPPIKV
jgi:hypothetical protein